MSSNAPHLNAHYYDGVSARCHVVHLQLNGETLRLEGEEIIRQVPLHELRISEPLGQAPRLITFADGACCEIRDHETLKALLTLSGHHDHWVVRMQFNWRWIAASLVMILAFLGGAYQWGVPYLSNIIAARVPAAALATLSDRALEALDEHWLAPSRLTLVRQHEITQRFAALLKPEAQQIAYRLVFRANRKIPANAFALPSGVIIITDDLVDLADDDRELMGVLAHELGHIVEHHGMRQLVRSSIVGAFATWIVGDLSSLAATVPASLLNATYSRQFEQEADQFAVHMLRKNAISPRCLANMLAHLEGAHERSAKGLSTYLSSHPATEERAKMLTGPACF